MNRARTCGGRMALAPVVWGLWVGSMLCLSAAGDPPADVIRIEQWQGTMHISTDGVRWLPVETNLVVQPGDRLRTGPNSRATLRWSDQSVVPFGALTEIEILPANQPETQAGLRLVKGILSFFHRDKPGRIRVITRGAVAGVEGTEFVLQVETVGNVERTILSLIDGKVEFSNRQGALVLTNMQGATAEVGKAPV